MQEDARSSRLVFVRLKPDAEGKRSRRKAIGVPDGIALEGFHQLVASKHRVSSIRSLTHASTGEPLRSTDELRDVEDLIADPGEASQDGEEAKGGDRERSPPPAANHAGQSGGISPSQRSKRASLPLPLTSRDEKLRPRRRTSRRRRIVRIGLILGLGAFGTAVFNFHRRISGG